MISPAFLIKILGCTTVGAFLTIGIPVIVVQKNKAADKAKAPAIQTKIDNPEITAIKPSESETTAVTQRQVEIDKPTNITNFLTNLVSVAQNLDPVIKSGETFSDQAIQAWTPTPAEKTAIAKNWSEAIEKMPNEFFKKLQDINLTKASGVCHIMTYNTKIGSTSSTKLYIPFLKSKLTSTIKNKLNLAGSVTAKADLINTHVGEFLKTNKKNFKTKLTAIAAGRQVPDKRVQYSWWSAYWWATEEKAIATDLLFLQTLYEGTIDRLTKELGNPDTSNTTVGGIIWEVSC